ncbi:TetR/AcrR family transcriptional regulator [Candidatus Solirubrobacter pratensis]|uniref:TetR/AcrR family transcriptional regulator n=1 Tax=Candidatus Solirubrobacter pratensis TaxID=1298857 RepID=UPI0004114135|nr:TetR/AcrR family transcriptional regulator [Candidatus Solirubrobacter pratensis]
MTTTELSAETRSQILDAALRRVREHGAAAISVRAIATDAGVSRQLVYFHYGNRAGLLTALAAHLDGTSALTELAEAPQPVLALEQLMRAWCAHLPRILPVARALEAASITGDEGASAWQERMRELHARFGEALARVELSPGWTTGTATDWVWSHLHPSAYAHLVEERGWTHAHFTEWSVGALLSELIEP